MPFSLNFLPERTEKPRDYGTTMALDKGFSVRQAEDFVETCADYVDVLKMGWGTSYITKNLKAKIDVYRNAGIPVYFGGTLFEAYAMRDQLDDYKRLLDEYDIDLMEVSNGTIWLSDSKKQEIITDFSKNYTVLSEVGSKNPNEIMPPYRWVEIIKDELEAGAHKIICEARESGTVGVFRPNGEVRSGLIDEIVHEIPTEKLIFEAPQKEQQVWFIKKFGSNVNLGNIDPNEVISLETIRQGLRGDTLLDFYSVDDDEMNESLQNNKSNSRDEN